MSIRSRLYSRLRRGVRQYAPAHMLAAIKRVRRWLPAHEAGGDEYPRMLGDEVGAVTRVLKSGSWNMLHGERLAHHALEEAFADYVGTKHAVAVNSGGMAIQISLRALGIKPGDEVIHQVDTCVANAFAIMAAGATPIFSDINPATMMMSEKSLQAAISERTKVLMPIHMWGHAENMDMALAVAASNKLKVIEDCCLSLGARYKGKPVGTFGDVGIFSFGMLKPMQAGEGGMIVTNDEALAKEMRTIRSYGDRVMEYGERNQIVPSWNGRMSEIVAAVLLEQLRNYENLMSAVQEETSYFVAQISNFEGIEVAHQDAIAGESIHTQMVLRLVDPRIQGRKGEILKSLADAGVHAWHANFEPINSLGFFRDGLWKEWILRGDMARIEQNYAGPFPAAEAVYESTGLGLFRSNFLSRAKADHALVTLKAAVRG